jgi:hypothetical protein
MFFPAPHSLLDSCDLAALAQARRVVAQGNVSI